MEHREFSLVEAPKMEDTPEFALAISKALLASLKDKRLITEIEEKRCIKELEIQHKQSRVNTAEIA